MNKGKTLEPRVDSPTPSFQLPSFERSWTLYNLPRCHAFCRSSHPCKSLLSELYFPSSSSSSSLSISAMEALSFSPTQSPLLRHNRLQNLARKSLQGNPRSNHFTRGRSVKPFITATLSKSAADISSTPSSSSTVTSHEDPLAASSPPLRPRVSPDSLQYPSGYLGAVPERTDSDGNDNINNAMGYLTNILSSKVYDVAIESPLQLAPKLSEKLGVKVWLKREDLQPVSHNLQWYD